MNRIGLLIALAVGAAVGLLFGLYPGLDLAFSAPFYDTATGRWLGFGPVPGLLRDASMWLVALVAAPAFIALAVKLVRPRRPLAIPGRAAVLMIATLALGPGILTNVVLKDNSGRARPADVTEFRGPDQFHPWWDMRGTCDKNCSFVAGEPSGALWTLSVAAVAPPAWRALGYGAALVFGAAVGLLRMAGGGHFFTDAVFGGVSTFLVIWLVHGLLYRWRPTRIGDAAVERALERLALPGHDALLRLIALLRGGDGKA